MPETSSNSNMVLRSMHLPLPLDDRLRSMAFRLRCAKAELMRHFLESELSRLEAEFGPHQAWTDECAEHVLARVRAAPANVDAETVKALQHAEAGRLAA